MVKIKLGFFMELFLLIIVFGVIITLIFYGLKNYNERVKQSLIKEADEFVDNIINSKGLNPISTNINLVLHRAIKSR